VAGRESIGPSHDRLALASAPVAGTGGNDAWFVALDAAGSISTAGRSRGLPRSRTSARASRHGTLEVSFDPLPAPALQPLFRAAEHGPSGSYDHGHGGTAAPLCAAPTQNAGGGRLKIVVTSSQVPSVDGYFLVTAHVDDVESPAGTRSSGEEIDRSQSICR